MGQILTPRPLHFACFGKQRGEQATVLPYRLRAAINCDFTLPLGLGVRKGLARNAYRGIGCDP